MPTIKKSSKSLEKVKAAVDKWEQLSFKYSSFGAADTEPDGVFQRCLYNKMEGYPVTVPKTASDWQLYTGEKGVGAVARSLTAALNQCLKIIGAVTVDDMDEVRSYLNDTLWRVA